MSICSTFYITQGAYMYIGFKPRPSTPDELKAFSSESGWLAPESGGEGTFPICHRCGKCPTNCIFTAPYNHAIGISVSHILQLSEKISAHVLSFQATGQLSAENHRPHGFTPTTAWRSVTVNWSQDWQQEFHILMCILDVPPFPHWWKSTVICLHITLWTVWRAQKRKRDEEEQVCFLFCDSDIKYSSFSQRRDDEVWMDTPETDKLLFAQLSL